jgi:hypothetical protein
VWSRRTYLEALTQLRFAIWLAVGLAIYLAYGRLHSRLQRGEDADSTETA